jgi:hypothetical protein
MNITCVTQNYLDCEAKDRFDLVLMITCDFCALSPTQRRGNLGKFHKILKPGASALLDVFRWLHLRRSIQTSPDPP